MEKKRVAFLDIAKGIGIITVVWAHAKGPGSAYIYQFHMPFFFLISGYLYRPEQPFREFAIRKVKSLYIPFAFWNLMALFLTLATGIAHMPAEAVIKKAMAMILALDKDGQFFGATWFLSALFWESVFYKALDGLLRERKHRRAYVTAVFFVGAAVGFCVNFPYMLSRNFILGGFFAIGALIREDQEQLKPLWKWQLAFVFFAAFVAIGHDGHANMGKNEYSSTIGFVVGALMAIYAVLYVSEKLDESKALLPEKGKQLFCFLGRKSIDIVIWQFVAFRIVIALQLWMAHEPLTLQEVLKYYPVYEAGHGWWILYTLVGIFGSILLGSILRKGSMCFFKYIFQKEKGK